MIALVTYPYRDRETLAVHYVGEEVELTDERFAELSAGGYVDLPPAGPVEAVEAVEAAGDDGAEDEGGEDAPPEEPAAGDPVAEMTVKQLRDAIESAGGFAPRKATKAELTAILAAL